MSRSRWPLDIDEGDLIRASEGAALMCLSRSRFYAIYRPLAIKLPQQRLLWDRRELIKLLENARAGSRVRLRVL